MKLGRTELGESTLDKMWLGSITVRCMYDNKMLDCQIGPISLRPYYIHKPVYANKLLTKWKILLDHLTYFLLLKINKTN